MPRRRDDHSPKPTQSYYQGWPAVIQHRRLQPPPDACCGKPAGTTGARPDSGESADRKIEYRMSAVTEFRDVNLRNGTTLRLRAPHAADSGALLAFMADLSERRRYLRFHGTGQPGLLEIW